MRPALQAIGGARGDGTGSTDSSAGQAHCLEAAIGRSPRGSLRYLPHAPLAAAAHRSAMPAAAARRRVCHSRMDGRWSACRAGSECGLAAGGLRLRLQQYAGGEAARPDGRARHAIGHREERHAL